MKFCFFWIGLRDHTDREERLRRIPSAYSYHLKPPAKNVTTEAGARQFFPLEYSEFLDSYEPLKKAKSKAFFCARNLKKK